MSLNNVLIGLGSNLNNPAEQLKKAIRAVDADPKISLKRQSSLYRSSPQGPQDQDDFFNAVIWVETALNPVDLLSQTQAIENSFGRVKTRHWGERIIDLDILFYNDIQISMSDPDLIIPHPFALERDFVVIPALEVAPDWVLPGASLLKDYESICIDHSLKRIPA